MIELELKTPECGLLEEQLHTAHDQAEVFLKANTQLEEENQRLTLRVIELETTLRSTQQELIRLRCKQSEEY